MIEYLFDIYQECLNTFSNNIYNSNVYFYQLSYRKEGNCVFRSITFQVSDIRLLGRDLFIDRKKKLQPMQSIKLIDHARNNCNNFTLLDEQNVFNLSRTIIVTQRKNKTMSSPANGRFHPRSYISKPKSRTKILTCNEIRRRVFSFSIPLYTLIKRHVRLVRDV